MSDEETNDYTPQPIPPPQPKAAALPPIPPKPKRKARAPKTALPSRAPATALEREPASYADAVKLVLERQAVELRPRQDVKIAKRAAASAWPQLWESAGKPRV